jgi:type II secretory ATPase GspE/PulE/Tfp pilus assembly ATPase PilB-like protein
MALRAAMTGHLLLSTLHTERCGLGGVRLVDLGVEPTLVGASLAGVLSQRLVGPSAPSAAKPIRRRRSSCASSSMRPPTDLKWYRGRGCHKCDFSGYKGAASWPSCGFRATPT